MHYQPRFVCLGRWYRRQRGRHYVKTRDARLFRRAWKAQMRHDWNNLPTKYRYISWY